MVLSMHTLKTFRLEKSKKVKIIHSIEKTTDESIQRWFCFTKKLSSRIDCSNQNNNYQEIVFPLCLIPLEDFGGAFSSEALSSNKVSTSGSANSGFFSPR